MNELEKRARLLKSLGPSSASNFGAALYSGKNGAHRKPQCYARAGHNALKELGRFGLARMLPPRNDGPQLWESTL